MIEKNVRFLFVDNFNDLDSSLRFQEFIKSK